MPTKNAPVSVFTAAQNIMKNKQKNQAAAGIPPATYTEKKKLPPKYQSEGRNVRFSDIKNTVTAAADYVGLDGKFGFQNSFGTIKGIGKTKSKK